MSQTLDDAPDEVLPSNLSLPASIPLKRELLREYEDQFRDTTTDSLFRDQILQTKQMAEYYIDYILENNHLNFSEKILQQYLNAFENFMKLEGKLNKLKQVRNLPTIEGYSSNLTSLTLDNLDNQHTLNQVYFPEAIKEEYAKLGVPTISDSTITKQGYQFLKQVLFLFKNPEDAIPDETEDDELNVSGGKISLKDPLTLNYFVKPVKSKRCNHVYEELSILLHLNTQRVCPISGCSAVLTRNDLILDKLMLIRIRSVNRVERHDDGNMETVV